MNTGVVIFIEKTSNGCLGAENRTGIVTDEKAEYGLLDTSPGYNVALANGQIWRINKGAKVKVLYSPLLYPGNTGDSN